MSRSSVSAATSRTYSRRVSGRTLCPVPPQAPECGHHTWHPPWAPPSCHCQPLTSVSHHKEDVLVESLWVLQPHLTAQLLDHVQSHLGTGRGGWDTVTSPCHARGHQQATPCSSPGKESPFPREPSPPAWGQLRGAASTTSACLGCPQLGGHCNWGVTKPLARSNSPSMF